MYRIFIQATPSLLCCAIIVSILLIELLGCSGSTASNDAPIPPDSSNANPPDDAPADDPTSEDSKPTGDDKKPSQRSVAPDKKGPKSPPKLPEMELFKDWPKPQFAILITGRQHGYVEPCGCTGLANQKGGLARRHTLQKELIERGWPLVTIDAGNQVRRFGPQPEKKFELSFDAFRHMKYDAVALGPDDLRIDLTQYSIDEEESRSMIVSANVAVIDRGLTREYSVATVGDKKVGITTILGTDACKKATGDLLSTESPEAGLKRVWAKLAGEKCDFYVLISHAPEKESRELITKFPQFNLVISASGAGEPLLFETPDGTKTTLVEVGTKSMYAGVIGVFDNAKTPIRNQYVPLSARFKDSPDMRAKFKNYQESLKSQGLLGEFGLLGRETAVANPTGLKFVGSEACKDCHEKAFDIWKNGIDGKGGPHFHATESLIHPGERGDIPRHFDPECLSCHVTGWNPQEYFPYLTGYLKVEDKLLHGNGCENCHGPGSKHVAAQNGDITVTEEERLAIQKRMVLTKKDAETKHCFTCHDIDNSPDFNVEGAFEKYWSQIKHYTNDN